MNINKYTEDDICDIYHNRICDNCGDCLKEEGIDIRAIKIEDIAKNIEENKFLEKEYEMMLESLRKENSSKLELNTNYEKELNSDYIDAFENIEYIEDLDCLGENLDDSTEEVFPGFRKLKGSIY